MPVSYAIDGASNIARITLQGVITTRDFDDFFTKTDADPAYHQDLHRLVIADDATAFPPSDEIRAVSRRVRERGISDEARIAVASRSTLAIGIVAMIVGNAGLSSQYEVFSDVARAEEWLKGQSEATWRDFLDRTQGAHDVPRRDSGGRSIGLEIPGHRRR